MKRANDTSPFSAYHYERTHPLPIATRSGLWADARRTDLRHLAFAFVHAFSA